MKTPPAGKNRPLEFLHAKDEVQASRRINKIKGELFAGGKINWFKLAKHSFPLYVESWLNPDYVEFMNKEFKNYQETQASQSTPQNKPVKEENIADIIYQCNNYRQAIEKYLPENINISLFMPALCNKSKILTPPTDTKKALDASCQQLQEDLIEAIITDTNKNNPKTLSHVIVQLKVNIRNLPEDSVSSEQKDILLALVDEKVKKLTQEEQPMAQQTPSVTTASELPVKSISMTAEKASIDQFLEKERIIARFRTALTATRGEVDAYKENNINKRNDLSRQQKEELCTYIDNKINTKPEKDFL